jgi:hypothetical protein
MTPPVRASASKLVDDASLLLADTTVFVTLAEMSCLAPFLQAFGPALNVTRDVAREVFGHSVRLPALRSMNLRIGGWDIDAATVDLSDAATDKALVIQKGFAKFGARRPHADLGEITTVLAAVEQPADLAVLDDAQGRSLALTHGVEFVTTENVACELVARGHLDEQDGLTVYISVLRVTRNTSHEYTVDVAQYRATI